MLVVRAMAELRVRLAMVLKAALASLLLPVLPAAEAGSSGAPGTGHGGAAGSDLDDELSDGD